jgi:alpha-beta hydrolase superfamily lysophospholipase
VSAVETEHVPVVASDGRVVDAWRTWRPDVGDDVVDARGAVVLCHGFVQNRGAFDAPGVSMVRHLRDQGWAVWSVEMRGRTCAGTAAGHCFAEYVERDAPAVIAEVARRHARVAWVGHSMGGLIGVALEDPARAALRALVAIGAPLLPAHHEVLRPERLAKLALFVTRRVATRGRPFKGKRYGRALHALARVLDHPRADFPLQVWAPGSMDPDDLAHALRESFCDDSFGAFNDLVDLALSRGERAGRVPIGARLRALRTPLLVVGADRDGLAPLAATRPLYERAGSAHKEFVEVSARTTGAPVGHVDLIIGRRAPAVVWPHVDAFLRRWLQGDGAEV